ncbi:hypothetical protein OED52_04270 [Rhodococcus sp. Z13]|uniref:Uncharacterized protein n=1 Tax=Rhodococcus sacchari TaxID=2962047 RepID=A0ACD4DII6_9NOCA|nr:hypothetical protein [Rhodococcus sp. Z13]UYP19780.1 hypothetical protein OED52_04270 [Rhodococcus sp. Z13]
MNRQTIVERAPYALVPLLGFALAYGLPMLGLRFAIEHGWYVAAAAAVAFLPGRGRLTAFDVLDQLAPEQITESEFRDHCGLMIDELERAAIASGRGREQWRTVPLWTESDVERIRRGILAERAELAELENRGEEPLGDEVTVTTVTAVDVAPRLRVTLDAITTEDGTDYELAFGTPDGCDDFPTLHLREIPALIDALSRLYRDHSAPAGRKDTIGGVR